MTNEHLERVVVQKTGRKWFLVTPATALIPPIPHEEGPPILGRASFEMDEHRVNRMQFGVHIVLGVESQHANQNHVLPVDATVRRLIALIDVVVMKTVPPGIRVIPVVHRFPESNSISVPTRVSPEAAVFKA